VLSQLALAFSLALVALILTPALSMVLVLAVVLMLT
jgi:hypothetical protein